MAGVRELLPLLFCDLWSGVLATLVQDTYCEVPSLLSCPHRGSHSYIWRRYAEEPT